MAIFWINIEKQWKTKIIHLNEESQQRFLSDAFSLYKLHPAIHTAFHTGLLVLAMFCYIPQWKMVQSTILLFLIIYMGLFWTIYIKKLSLFDERWNN